MLYFLLSLALIKSSCAFSDLFKLIWNIQRLFVLACCGGSEGLLVIKIDYGDYWPVIT